MATVHVVPLGDSIEHSCSEGVACSCMCKPDVEVLPGGGVVVTHNSFDGNERFEANAWKVRSERP